MQLITENIENKFKEYVFEGDVVISSKYISDILDDLYASIPDNKRISYGRVYTIKITAKYIYENYSGNEDECFVFAEQIFHQAEDHRVKGVALGILSLYGRNHFDDVLAFFIESAGNGHWEMREFAQMFFRKIIKVNPEKAQEFLLKKVKSESPNIRRFVGETLRPVIENRWFYNDPEYSLKVLRLLFKESVAYPRTAVGNNLSDLSRKLPELVFNIVGELVACNDKNSYWIAYRACRNLVKKYPVEVMDLLKIDEYKYKSRVHRRDDI